MTALNAGGEAPGPTKYLVIRNVFDASPESGDFVYIGGAQDGFFGPLPAEIATATLTTSRTALCWRVHLRSTWLGKLFDTILGTAHLGILNSPTCAELRR